MKLTERFNPTIFDLIEEAKDRRVKPSDLFYPGDKLIPGKELFELATDKKDTSYRNNAIRRFKLSKEGDELYDILLQYLDNYGTHNKKISEKFKGVNNHRYGTLAVNRRKVQCITTGKKFNSIKEASDYYSVNRVTISECCKGKRKSSGKHPVTGEKLIWRYLD